MNQGYIRKLFLYLHKSCIGFYLGGVFLISMLPIMAWAQDFRDLSIKEQEITSVQDNKIIPINSANELWEKILKITNLPRNGVTKDEIESTLHIKLVPAISPNTKKVKQGLYVTTLEESQPFYVESIMDNDFIFSWGSGRNVTPPKGMCIISNSVRSSLENQGWQKGPEPIGFDGRIVTMDVYRDAHGRRLNLDYDFNTRCITRVYFSNGF